MQLYSPSLMSSTGFLFEPRKQSRGYSQSRRYCYMSELKLHRPVSGDALTGKVESPDITGPDCRLTDAPMPRPLRDVQTVRHIICRVVVTRHCGRGSPREIIVKHAPELLVAGEADIFERQIETVYRPLVHLLVRPVAAVNPHDRGLITVPARVRCWPTESLPPVRGKALSVLRVVSVAERMANHFVL
jgi:hypothetical protein